MDAISIVGASLLGALLGGLVTYRFMTMSKPGPRERAFILRSTGISLFLIAILLLAGELFTSRHPNLTPMLWVGVLLISIFAILLNRKHSQIRNEEQAKEET